MPLARPSIDVAVVMRKRRLASAWQPWRWELAEVSIDEGGFGREPRSLLQVDGEERWLHPGFTVELHPDDAEGYLLNATTDAPAWFVLWRPAEDGANDGRPSPIAVSLSYHDAGRWLDAQEQVEQVPAPVEVIAWMREFAGAHYVPEPKKRKRPESFKSLVDRFGNPASVSTEKVRGGGGPDRGGSTSGGANG